MSLRDILGLNRAKATPVPSTPTIKLPPPCTGAGLYGKLPIQADFVRLNAGGFASGGFDRWLEDGVGAVHAARGTPKNALVTFFAYAASAPNACIGMIGPSIDKVGRGFPAALFAYLDPSVTSASAFAMEALGGFLFEAQAHVAGLPGAQAAPNVSEITVPNGEAQLAAVQDAATRLTTSKLGETLSVIFGATETKHWEHALATCLAACATSKGRFPEKTIVTLDLPAGDDRAVDFWLALVTTALGWPSGAPAWLWDSEGERLILALGPPTPSLFVALAIPDWAGARHWVVRSIRPEATAPASLADLSRSLVNDTEATVADFLNSIAT
jgi:type VI secretion system protein ImpM